MGTIQEFDVDSVPDLIMQLRLHEAAQTFMPGDVFPADLVEYDRLVFCLAKEYMIPVGGWQELPEPLFTDVMVKRD